MIFKLKSGGVLILECVDSFKSQFGYML